MQLDRAPTWHHNGLSHFHPFTCDVRHRSLQMCRSVVSAVVAGLATLFVALPITAVAAPESVRAPLAPKRLVVDSASAPVLSVDQAALTVDIVLVPDGEYQPVHPDSLDSVDESSPPAPLDSTGNAEKP